MLMYELEQLWTALMLEHAYISGCEIWLILMAVFPCVVREKSNAIIGVVTAGFECLPPRCDGLTGPDDHGPMISTSRFAVRGIEALWR
ncbi:hypothetical protein F511_09781 [Dorcoceras hygrometricum]|uniref:Uncharacterized protein n=1 Tax=Dorcoceras hygrometricum TaxID=472368 RepID=A0A2Z7ACY1_9LAMI|nr:hypothetical protein F511_09781 [Dorcoceras hygrometricum]